MAKSKYFHVKHVASGAEKLVKAARQSLAIQAVSGGKGAIRSAADEEIHQHLINGGTLHEKSCPEGDGKLFLVHGEPQILIRAKNAATAFQLLNDGAYSVEIATQDALVRLITAGVTIIDADDGIQKKSDESSQSGADVGTDAEESVDATPQEAEASSIVPEPPTDSAPVAATAEAEAATGELPAQAA